MSEHPANKQRWLGLRGFWRKRIPLSVVVPIFVVALLSEIFFRNHMKKFIGEMGAPTEKRALGIKALIQEVRSELAAVEKEIKDRGEKALFELTEFEMELNFVVRASSSQTSGVKTELVTAESVVELGSERVQKLTLHWKAADETAFTGRAGIVQPADVNVTETPPLKKKNP